MSESSRSRTSLWRPGRIIALGLFLAIAVLFIPHPVAANADQIQSLRISYEGESLPLRNEAEIKELLGQLSCSRSFQQHTSYPLEGTYEIDLLYNDGPLHIVLGRDTQFCYSDPGVFKEFNISNGASALDRLNYLLTP